MDPGKFTCLFLLFASIVLMVGEWISIDLVAMGVMILLVVTGVLSPETAVVGFANPAIITIAALFIVSEGLVKTGTIAWIGQRISKIAKGSETRVVLFGMIVVAIASAFINNTPVVVMFVPVMLGICGKFGIAPSRVLIPISFASILGGNLTLIGTSSNILISQQAVEVGLPAFSMFTFTPVGLIYAGTGLLFLILLSRFLLPARQTFTSMMGQGNINEYLTQIQINPGARWVGRSLGETVFARHPGLRVLQIVRQESILWPPLDQITLRAEDVLMVKASVNDVVELLRSGEVSLQAEIQENYQASAHEMTFAEIVITPTSGLIDRNIEEVAFSRRYRAFVLAILRRGEHLREKISGLRLRIGDVLLIQGDHSAIHALREEDDIMLLENVEETVLVRHKAPIAVCVFLAIITLAIFHFERLPIMILALAGAGILVGTGCLSPKQAYRAVSWQLIVLMSGMLALGTAMEKTGTAEWIAQGMVKVLQPLGPYALLSGIAFVSSLLASLMSANAIAVLMVPIAAGVAEQVGIQAMPLVMGVLFGVHACFATPFGYQTNTFIYGPGGYKYLDFVKIGLPLNLLLCTVTTIAVPWYWPF
ncbi:MAG: SLC13 family permease [Planctomycetota bacterium]|nr:SLC13 family permease [Planctomycetota bacterium]